MDDGRCRQTLRPRTMKPQSARCPAGIPGSRSPGSGSIDAWSGQIGDRHGKQDADITGRSLSVSVVARSSPPEKRRQKARPGTSAYLEAAGERKAMERDATYSKRRESALSTHARAVIPAEPGVLRRDEELAIRGV
ncbi:hypothetical protein CDD80_3679 [Ophiocordyceps camponoti-rufipedis]|uniref:Uncharacterized protein n=1 Tax=Ophiocordyceps camponoti-rufipedis TaxID=2004952 RepID=A0A2C5YP16_9HYPO|nr:hypothetical protein CDD80_3679 [Ophiocordyceps camponoti-rufipedis]